MLRDGGSSNEVAALRGAREDGVLEEFVRTLAKVGRVDRADDLNVEIGRYLLFKGPAATRVSRSVELITSGVNPLDLDGLEQTMHVIRSANRRAWSGQTSKRGRNAAGTASNRA
jgi:hypothetical protein